jgi:hypothetical protein
MFIRTWRVAHSGTRHGNDDALGSGPATTPLLVEPADPISIPEPYESSGDRVRYHYPHQRRDKSHHPV